MTVELEQLLYQLDTKIAIVKMERAAARAGTLQPISQVVAQLNDEQLYELLQRSNDRIPFEGLLVKALDKYPVTSILARRLRDR